MYVQSRDFWGLRGYNRRKIMLWRCVLKKGAFRQCSCKTKCVHKSGWAQIRPDFCCSLLLRAGDRLWYFCTFKKRSQQIFDDITQKIKARLQLLRSLLQCAPRQNAIFCVMMMRGKWREIKSSQKQRRTEEANLDWIPLPFLSCTDQVQLT